MTATFSRLCNVSLRLSRCCWRIFLYLSAKLIKHASEGNIYNKSTIDDQCTTSNVGRASVCEISFRDIFNVLPINHRSPIMQQESFFLLTIKGNFATFPFQCNGLTVNLFPFFSFEKVPVKYNVKYTYIIHWRLASKCKFCIICSFSGGVYNTEYRMHLELTLAAS